MTQQSGSGGGNRGGLGTLIVVVVIVAIVASGLFLTGCDSPAAQRERAEAERIRAEAQAYEQRLQADTAAAAERAAIREAAREAGHQRSLEILPYVIVIVGALLLAGVATLMFWDLRRTPPAHNNVETSMRLYLEDLERLQLHQAERERALWRAIARMQRQSLADANRSQEIVIVEEPRR